LTTAEKKKTPQRGGSKFGRRKSKPRQRIESYTMLYTDYFVDEAPNVDDFRRHYRKSKGMFMSILHGVREYDNYFVLKHDCCGTNGFPSIRKCTVAMRMVAYGAHVDS
jgi:hypothetical protein